MQNSTTPWLNGHKDALVASSATFVLTSIFFVLAFIVMPAIS